MKKTNIILIYLVISGLFPGMEFNAQDQADKDLDKILLSIKNTNIDQLSSYLNEMVELTVPGSEGTYSSKQAKFLLKEFFKKYPPVSIQLKHKGNSSKGSKFAIYHYKHKSGKFRLYYLIKEKNNKYLIDVLRFENI